MQSQQIQQPIEPPKVSFSVCRPGAVIEFEVFEGKPVQGTVAYLRFAGARNFLVVFSKLVERDGTVKPGINAVTGMPEAINLSHATRVLSHGKGDLLWDTSDYVSDTVQSELRVARQGGAMHRRGRRLVVDGRRQYAPNLVRWMMHQYIWQNTSRLGVLPWDVLDLDGLFKRLEREGIVRYQRGSESSFSLPMSAQVDMPRMTRFVQRNINRFKCKLSVQAREDERLDAEAYERDEYDELMTAY